MEMDLFLLSVRKNFCRLPCLGRSSLREMSVRKGLGTRRLLPVPRPRPQHLLSVLPLGPQDQYGLLSVLPQVCGGKTTHDTHTHSIRLGYLQKRLDIVLQCQHQFSIRLLDFKSLRGPGKKKTKNQNQNKIWEKFPQAQI